MKVPDPSSIPRRAQVHAGALFALGVLLAGCSILPHVQSQTTSELTGADAHYLAAELQATTLLSSFTPPPGSVRLSSAPSGSPTEVPPSTEATPEFLDVTGLWRTHGDMATVLAWVRRHRASNWIVVGTGESTHFSQVQEQDLTFSVPTAGPAIESSQVLVSVARSGPNSVTLRVDVQDVWIPTRPGWSFVPPSVRSVTATVWTGSNERPHSTTSTTLSTIVALRRLVNAMPVSTIGETSCPAFTGDRFALTFEGNNRSRFIVSGLTVECGGITLLAVGHGHVGLMDTDGRVLAAIEALAGAK